MTHHVKALDTTPNNLSLISRTHILEGKNRLPKTVLWPSQLYHGLYAQHEYECQRTCMNEEIAQFVQEWGPELNNQHPHKLMNKNKHWWCILVISVLGRHLLIDIGLCPSLLSTLWESRSLVVCCCIPQNTWPILFRVSLVSAFYFALRALESRTDATASGSMWFLRIWTLVFTFAGQVLYPLSALIL